MKYWEISEDRAGEFRRLGIRPRDFFPHHLHYLRKGGPDGMKLAQRMYGVCDPGALRQLVLYATGPALKEFPGELFFCNDLVWHQQHFGKPGHVATANLVVQGPRLYTTARFSDVVQRIGRRREHKTRIEKVLGGWDRMLLNGIVHFAAERQLETIHFPTADFALQHTDRKRRVQRPLFERLYDRDLRLYSPVREGLTWVVDVRAAARRLVAPVAKAEAQDIGGSICLCHDIERGHGHLDVDPAFASVAEQQAPQQLAEILRLEHGRAVPATFHVVGCLMPEVRTEIEQHGHGLGFHSYDHADGTDQLERCRRVDYRLRGYRPPRSRITDHLRDDRLAFHNFEWLASSSDSLGGQAPRMENGVAKLPIFLDDHSLHTGKATYAEWQQRLLAGVAARPYAAFSLHDCYAAHWLPRFDELLARLSDMGTLRRLDDVANALILGTGE